MKPAILASLIAFLTMSWKTWWDLWYLPRKFKRDCGTAGEDLKAIKKAAQKKRDSQTITATIAFALIGVSSLIQIGGELTMNEKVVPYEVFEQRLNKVENNLSERIVRLENILLDPTGPTGPGGGGIPEKIKNLEEKLDSLSALIDKHYSLLSSEIKDNYKITSELIETELEPIKKKLSDDDREEAQEMEASF